MLGLKKGPAKKIAVCEKLFIEKETCAFESCYLSSHAMMPEDAGQSVQDLPGSGSSPTAQPVSDTVLR